MAPEKLCENCYAQEYAEAAALDALTSNLEKETQCKSTPICTE